MISDKDQILLQGKDPKLNSGFKQEEVPKIAPNSEYDVTIAFDSSSSEGEFKKNPAQQQVPGFGFNGNIQNSPGGTNLKSYPIQPGEFSPRPSPDEVNDLEIFSPGGFGSNNLHNFEINFNGPGGGPTPVVGTPIGFGSPGAFPNTNQQAQQQQFNFSPLGGAGRPQNQPIQGGMKFGVSDYSPRPNNEPDYNSTFSSPALAQLFGVLSKFQPPPLDLAPHFKPFLPELIPSVGQIDAFIKVPRPDGAQDALGLTVLDEPTIGQSNPQILRMQLREKFGVMSGNESDGYIGCIREPVKNEKELNSFLDSYDEIQRNRPAPQMKYTTTMPDTEILMEEFPPELVECLQSAPFPNADIDMTLEEYTQTICSMLDIPVRGNIIESLHMLFTLYQQFRNNLYFKDAGSSRGSTPLKQNHNPMETEMINV